MDTQRPALNEWVVSFCCIKIACYRHQVRYFLLLSADLFNWALLINPFLALLFFCTVNASICLHCIIAVVRRISVNAVGTECGMQRA